MDRISFYLEENIDRLQKEMNEVTGLVLRRFYIAQENGTKRAMLVAYLDGLNDKIAIDSNILTPLMDPLCIVPANNDGFLKRVIEERLCISNVKPEQDFIEIIENIVNANCVLLADGVCEFYSFELKKFPHRAITEPETDVVVRGPREGFNESVQVNLSLLRRKIKHKGFKSEMQKIGRYSQTDICVCYVDGIVKPQLVTEVKERLGRIDIDGIFDSGYIEQFIEDCPLSIFPTVGNAEKPDIIATKLLEGKVAIIVDGSPAVLFVPKLFPESFSISEDYYNRYYYQSLLRILRWVAYIFAILSLGFYIAITTYHQELIPSNLILMMIASEESTPFSTGLSVFLMLFVYEVLREVGVRLPRPLGQPISIVGALVMGDAAVAANIISPPILIIVAFAVLCSYVSPPLNNVTAVLRLVFIAAGWAFGCFGMLIVGIVLIYYMASMRSFGVPYLAPLAPFMPSAIGDIFIRKPLWQMLFRPPLLSNNYQRMSDNLKPHPPKKSEDYE